MQATVTPVSPFCALCVLGTWQRPSRAGSTFPSACVRSSYVGHTVFKVWGGGQYWCVDVSYCWQGSYSLYRYFLFTPPPPPFSFTVKRCFVQFTHSLRGILEPVRVSHLVKSHSFMESVSLLPFSQHPATYPCTEPV